MREQSGVHAANSIESLCAAHAPIESGGSFASGTVFGDWRVTAFIGRGGNGEVYCAEHVSLGTPAAVKVLVRDEERAKVRFEREAKLLAKMKSKAFPRFFAYGEANLPTQSVGVIKRTAYIAMELLEPGELPKGDRAVARFMLNVCDAVSELHAIGYVHRDIKPGNILWRMVGSCAPRDRGRAGRASQPIPVLADLGLVKTAQPSNSQTFQPSNSTITLAGVGTPGYGAPEQMERGEATAASDIHALGVLADRCFDGKPPRAWKRIVERATSSIPERRYPSVAALSRAIRCRHLQRYAIDLMVLLMIPVLISMWVENQDPRNFDFIRTTPVSTSTPARTVIREIKLPRYQHKLNSLTKLNEGRSILTPILLEGGKEYQIVGPGMLEGDIFCPTTAVLRLKNCVLLNTTTRLYPENGIQYRLENGVYLNFLNIKKLPPELRAGDFIAPYDGAYNQVRFGGPETVEELMDQISEEQVKDLQETKWQL